MSEFYSENSGEGRKASSENSEFDKENKIETSVDKALEYRDFIEQQQTKSTTEKTKSNLKIWGKFCHQRNEFRKLEAIPWVELNLLLCAFFKDARKKNGDEYEHGTLTCLQRSMQRYLNTHGSQANLIPGDEFKLSPVQKENSLSWKEGREIVHKQAEKLPLLKKTSSLPKDSLASTTLLLYSAQFGGSWLYILALEREMKVEGSSGGTSALKMIRTRAMKCWSGKLNEARRRARAEQSQRPASILPYSSSY